MADPKELAVRRYEPEVGQFAFGQPWQELECPDWLVKFLGCLREAMHDANGLDPFGNTGQRYDNTTFSVHAYDWGDDPQPWNFRWRDVTISWYKYLGRGTTVNRVVGQGEARTMIAECIASLSD